MGSMLERALQSWAERVRREANVPVRLRWGTDGASTVALGEAPTVEIRVHGAAAWPLLIEPGLDTLGQAYVEGLVDVDGRLSDIVEVAHGLAASAQPTSGLLGRIVVTDSHPRAVALAGDFLHVDTTHRLLVEHLRSNR